MYNFDEILDRKNTDAKKWDMLEELYGEKDILPFWVADTEFKTPPELSKAIIERAEHETYGYTYASEEYYDSFINWNKNRNDFEVKKEEIISIPGVVCAFSFILHALTEKGDKVLLNTPLYDPFHKVIDGHERTVVKSSLILKDGRYEVDWDDFESKIKDGVKLFVLCSPHNPLGRVWTLDELRKIVEICYRHKVIIFSDEIHSDLIFEGHKHIPIMNVGEEAKEISIVAMAPSKTFNIAGLKSSFIVVKNNEMRDKISSVIDLFHVGVNLFGLKATEAAYKYGSDWTDELVKYLYDNCNFVVDYIKENLPKVNVIPPEGTYLMWLDFSVYGLSQEELMRKMACEAKVALNDGSNYGDEGLGFVRLNIGTSREMLKEGLEQIKRVFG